MGVDVGNAEGGFQTLLQCVNEAVVLAKGASETFAVFYGVESDYRVAVLCLDSDWAPDKDVFSGLTVGACVSSGRTVPEALLHVGARWRAAEATHFAAGMAA